MNIDQAYAIRIAIALGVLKQKAPDQSFAACILELQRKFTLVSAQDEEGEVRWRKRALVLEHEYEELQAKYESEQIKVLTLEKSIAEHTLPSEQHSDTGAPPRKKAKKKQVSTPVECDKSARLRKSHNLSDVPIIEALSNMGSHPLFTALNDVHQLLSLTDVNLSLLASVTLRLIKAAAAVLKNLLNGPSPGVSSDTSTLSAVGNALSTTLSNVLSTLATVSHEKDPALGASSNSSSSHNLVHLIEQISTLILNPLVNSFNSLTAAHLSSTFPETMAAGQLAATKPSVVSKPPGHPNVQVPINQTQDQLPYKDIRPDALYLFETILTTLYSHLRGMAHTLVPHSMLVLSTLRQALIAETLRALHKLLSTSCSLTAPDGDEARVSSKDAQHRVGDRFQRVKKLVLRDSLWYLCAVLHLLFKDDLAGHAQGPQLALVTTPAREDPLEQENEAGLVAQVKILRESNSTDLCRLVLKCKRSRFQQQATMNDRGPAQSDGVGDLRDIQESREYPEPGVVGTTGAISVESDGASAAGLNCKGSGIVQGAAGPENQQIPIATEVSEGGVAGADDGNYWLDDAEYDVLLGAIERFWTWNGC